MDNPENEFVQIHQEGIRSEATISAGSQAIRDSQPTLIDRCLSCLGDALIQHWTRLKERAYTRLTS